jgi:hypothetical protein
MAALFKTKFSVQTESPSKAIILALLLATTVAVAGCGQAQQYAATGGTTGGGGGSTGGGTGGSTGGGSGGSGTTGTGTVTLSWNAPTSYSDQSCVTNLAGYTVNYGTSSGAYGFQESIPVGSANCVDTGVTSACGPVMSCSYTVKGLSKGKWYFSTSAYTADSTVSPLSNEASYSVN